MKSTTYITTALAAGVPILLWGPPGTGKTATIMAMAKEMGAHVEVLIGSTMDPTDAGGWFVPDADGEVQQSPPPWARRCFGAICRGEKVIVFFDELSTAPPAVQASMLRVVNEKQVAGLDLTGVQFIAAANRAEHAADGGIIDHATSNRWAHVEWSLDMDTWIGGTLKGWGEKVPAGWAKAAASVTAYIRRNRSAWLDPDASDSSRPWPSPRSWTNAIRLLAYAPQGADRVSLVASTVGDAAASEWAQHEAAGDLPDPKALLDGTVAWPERGDQVLVAALAMVSHAVSSEDRGLVDVAAVRLAGLRTDVAVPAAVALLVANDDIVPDPLRGMAKQIRDARKALG